LYAVRQDQFASGGGKGRDSGGSPGEVMTEDEINLAWSHSIAELIADALVAGKVIAKTEYERAREIIAEEVLARLCVHDRPDQTNPRYKSN